MWNSRPLIVALGVALAARETMAQAAGTGGEEFSLVAFGDSRLPGYFPYRATEAETVRKLLDQTLRYAYGDAAKFGTDLHFHPVTGALEWLRGCA